MAVELISTLPKDKLLTEDQIEMICESMGNVLDRKFLRGAYDQDTYERHCNELNRWANQKYAQLRAARNRMKGE